MKQIWKFELDRLFHGAECHVHIQENYQFLDIQEKDDKLFIWALVEPTLPKLTHVFRVIGTGHSHPVLENGSKYLKTVQWRDLVWHIFENGTV